MIPKYIPILKAKKGEFDAYHKLTSATKVQTLPMFELPRFTATTQKRAAFKDKHNPIECYLDEITNQIAEARKNAPVLIDIFKWASNACLENGEHILSYATSRLNALGTSVIPVIGYERWEDTEYTSVLKALSCDMNRFCIRLESYAFEDMIEEEHFIDNLDEIIATLDLDTSKCNVILDFADATKISIIDMQEKITEAMKLLKPYQFNFISIAGCSVASIINDMVPEINSSAVVVRKEMISWKAARKFSPDVEIIFGDYGIANPSTGDDIIAPDANGKVRYTTSENYFVVRGYSRRKGDKGAQMYELCQKIVSSAHYMGEHFSWGDERIKACANEELKGNLTTWISIDTNHHIAFVLAEVLEFEKVQTSIQYRSKAYVQ